MKKTISAFVLLAAWSATAAFQTGRTLYENQFTEREMDSKQLSRSKVHLPRGGENGDGALWIRDPKEKSNPLYRIVLDPAMFSSGGYYVLEAKYRGEDLKKGERHYFGPAITLCYKTRSLKNRTRWKGAEIQLGTPNWTHYFYVEKFQPNDVTEIAIHINNHQGRGEFYVDWVRISEGREIPDETVVPPENKEAAAIRRGRDIFKADSRNHYSGPITRYRGFQVNPNRLTVKDIDDLGKWGANLIRFGVSGGEPVKTEEEYLRWVDSRIARLDSLMPHLERNGIKVVIAFSKIPGAKRTNYASVNLKNSSDFGALEKAWKKVASHYRKNPNIYGYDLLNEPAGIDADDWNRVAEELVKAIRTVDPDTLVINPFVTRFFPGENMAYSPHIYQPHTLTHQGVAERGVAWKYPGYINGVYWDKEQLRVTLKPFIDFQQKYNARIYIGEFSCIAWAEGRDRYIQDCIELFEEYGWDWTYHAFREWPPWSVEHERAAPYQFRKADRDTPAKKTLLKYFKLNH